MPTEKIVDFTPAGPGWRVVFIAPDTEQFLEPVAGWLTLEDEYGERCIRAAVATDLADELVAASSFDNFHRVLGPGQLSPEPLHPLAALDVPGILPTPEDHPHA